MRLDELATIRPGFISRKKPDYSDSGNFRIIRMQDVKDDNTIDWLNVERVDIDNIKTGNILNKGDILFKSRGGTHTAAVVDRDESKVIAVAQFFIIRPEKNILPEFLAWYINQKKAQQYIALSSAGTSIQHISKQALGGLDIPVPDMETQSKISELYSLSHQEKLLTEKIQQKRNQLLNAVMLNAIGGKNCH